MFSYFRYHRRGTSPSLSSPIQNPSTQQTRPQSSATIASTISSNPSTTPISPITKSSASPSFISSHRFYTKSNVEDSLPEILNEEADTAPIVSTLPPVLPPIPRIAETIEDKDEESLDAHYPVHDEVKSSPHLPALPSIHTNPLRLNAVPKLDSLPVTRIALQKPNSSKTLEQSVPNQHYDFETPASMRKETRMKEDKNTQPIGFAYQVDFGEGFELDDGSLLGNGDVRDQSKSFKKTSPPPSPSIRGMTVKTSRVTPSVNDTQLLTSRPVPDRAVSPTSSSSSFQKSSSSTNLTIEVSPISQSPVSVRTIANPPAPPTLSAKISKPRRSLLNPVSLLMRRRTANGADLLTDVGLANKQLDTATSVPENYDPRIKGKGVHDFNVPRPRRNHSTNDLEDEMLSRVNMSPGPEYKRRESAPWVPPHFEIEDITDVEGVRAMERERLPVFFEDFETSIPDDYAIHRETLANQSFLARAVDNNDVDLPISPSSRRDGVKFQKQNTSLQEQARCTIPGVTITNKGSREPNLVSDGAILNLSPTSNVVADQDLSSSTDLVATPQLLTSPQHQSSNASRISRFSFQFADENSVAQEHELEERHKKKAAEKAVNLKHTSATDSHSSSGGEDDSISFDDVDDDATFEEPVPGVNADAEDFDNHFRRSLDMTEHVSSGKPFPQKDTTDVVSSTMWSPPLQKVINDLTATSTQIHEGSFGQGHQHETSKDFYHNDDMYFDDGVIEEIQTSGAQQFDESIFDSSALSRQPGDSPIKKYVLGGVSHSELIHEEISPDRGGHEEVALGILPGELVSQPVEKNLHGPGLNLDAYHCALASAATEAHAAGYFKREMTEEPLSSDGHDLEPPRTDGSSSHDYTNSSSVGQGFFELDEDSTPPTDWPSYDDVQDEREYDDDEYNDDPMISAANAEALAADESGFYGREFNFYGQGKPGTELYNGGFFRDPAKDGLGRTTSIRDPTLTPITERSEFSRAPSYMSLNTFGNINTTTMAAPLASPGLKELAARYGLDHNDLTLKQLMKLRKEAFSGGTAGSSGSSASSFSSSPLIMRSSIMPQTPASIAVPTLISGVTVGNHGESDASIVRNTNDQAEYGHDSVDWDLPGSGPYSATSAQVPNIANMRPATHPVYNRTSIPSSDSTSSTIATNFPAVVPSALSPIPSSMPMPPVQLMQKFANRPPASSATYAEREASKRESIYQMTGNGSNDIGQEKGSDSVAYVRERDQWFIEKRRTMGNGEVIVLAKDLVKGGRI